MWLSASENLKHTGELWNSSFVVRGLFGDFYPYFLWEIFGKETIGITSGASTPEGMVQKVVQFLNPSKLSSIDGTPENITFKLPKELEKQK